jgi:hypothetical protein
MEKIKNHDTRHTQKDYALSFNLSVVSEIEQGNLSVTSVQKQSSYGDPELYYSLYSTSSRTNT